VEKRIERATVEDIFDDRTSLKFIVIQHFK